MAVGKTAQHRQVCKAENRDLILGFFSGLKKKIKTTEWKKIKEAINSGSSEWMVGAEVKNKWSDYEWE